MGATGSGGRSHGVIIICSNCGERTGAMVNEEGYVRIRCRQCGAVMERQEIGRRHVRIEVFAPHGQVLMNCDDE